MILNNVMWWNDSFYSCKIVSELLKICMNHSFTLCGKPQVKMSKKLKELFKFKGTQTVNRYFPNNFFTFTAHIRPFVFVSVRYEVFSNIAVAPHFFVAYYYHTED